jgi:hypothetical protein
MLALGLAATTVRTTPAISRLVSSAQTVHHNFESLKASDIRLSPVERLVYSLVMSNTRATCPLQHHT